MKRYEFQTVECKENLIDSSYMPDEIDKMGENGWMIVTAIPRLFSLGTIYVMQREITED